MTIVFTVLIHWFASLFTQTFFMHRYGAHRMFNLSKFWEKFFYAFAYLAQNVSFLNPRAYAILHRMHHAYSDTDKDPHSPMNYNNIMGMMKDTAERYFNIRWYKEDCPKQFEGGYPTWKFLDSFSESWYSRAFWIAAWVTFYFFFASAWWMWLFLPLHFIMGPLHGAIVNWFGHKAGYRNFNSEDNSRNTLAFDLLMLGELFQNNHHHYPLRPNFAVRRFEFDPVYQVMRVFALLGIIRYPKKSKRVEDKTAPTAGKVVLPGTKVSGPSLSE